MGGTVLAPSLSTTPAIELLPTLSQSASVFLRSLDCFFYRTGRIVEAGGRVVIEAMASALPVVCHRVGGYAEWIEHGESGFLFETDEEAFQILTRLKSDPDLRRTVGAAARTRVETIFSARNQQRLIDYYLR